VKINDDAVRPRCSSGAPHPRAPSRQAIDVIESGVAARLRGDRTVGLTDLEREIEGVVREESAIRPRNPKAARHVTGKELRKTLEDIRKNWRKPSSSETVVTSRTSRGGATDGGSVTDVAKRRPLLHRGDRAAA
jgi:hypothetical protein